MNYYYCYYHLYQGNHINYHHVIMKCSPDLLMNLEEESYLYFLRSSKAVYLTQEQLDDEVYKGLIMDGESLLKRIKKQINQKIENESISVQ